MKPSKAAVKRVRHACLPSSGPPRHEPGDSPREDQPDRAGLGELLPRGSVVHRVRSAGRASVAAHLQVGMPRLSPQAETLNRQQVLRPVQPGQAGPMGVRRPQQRRLPPQVRLDGNRPAPAGPRGRVSGRPRPGRLLDRTAQQEQTAARRRTLHPPKIAPVACLSRVPRRVARTVLRGPRRSNASGLPDCVSSSNPGR
jgi:hypothetical protein